MNTFEQEFWLWAQNINTIASIPLALGGFGIALWQINKTKTAATAAKDAAEHAAARLENSSILILIPQLQECESELVRAVRGAEKELLLKLITQWRWQAGQLRGLLDDDLTTHKRIGRHIQLSITVAGDARGIASSGQDITEVGQSLLAAVSKVTADFGELSQRTLRKVDVPLGNE